MAKRLTQPEVRRCSSKGFTMVELIVAISVFGILITVAVGVFLQALRSQRELIRLMAINNNTGLVLEQLVRDMRTGYKFVIPGGAASCGFRAHPFFDQLEFTDPNRGTIRYYLAGEGIKRDVRGSEQALSAENVAVEKLCFKVDQESDICNPWRVTVVMSVKPIQGEKTAAVIPIQATVSSRVLPKDIREVKFNVCRRS